MKEESVLTVLIPAHNEEDGIKETLDSVFGQTLQPDRVIVIADNCTDRTEAIAHEMGAQVFVTVDNVHKKAGALNQWLDIHLANFTPDNLVMVMDADSALDEKFLENASGYIAKGYGACGGVFSGKSGGGFVGMLQRNEYARYARDVKRKRGKTLVLTGTATLFTAGALQSVVKARQERKLHKSRGKHSANAAGPRRASVYDVDVLTEDNELTFALLHLGYKIIAPAQCQLQTEVMETWTDLWRQRHRWKRGAIENNVQYGLTRYTAKYWGLQIWGFLGVIVTIIYLTTTVWAAATWQLHFYAIWVGVTAFYALERSITVRKRGWKMSLLGTCIVVEMTFDIFLQAVHCKAFLDAIRRAKKAW